MRLRIENSGVFLQYYFMTLCFLSFLGFLAVGFVAFNKTLPMSSSQAPGLKSYFQEEEAFVNTEENHHVQDVSGDPLTYEVNREVTHENGNVVETYIYEYKK